MKSALIVISYLVDMANPNGNIEDGGPRVTPDNFGFISHVCQKRNLRNPLLLTSESRSELIEAAGADPDRCHILESWERGFEGASPKDAIKALKELSIEKMREKYFDARMFGCMPLDDKNKDKDSESSGRTKISQGCLQFGMARSICPISVVEQGLQKKAPLRGDFAENKISDLAPGSLRVVDHGLYYSYAFLDGARAKENGVSEGDIRLLKSMIPSMFSSRSAQRAGVGVVNALWIEHSSAKRSFNEMIIAQHLRPTLKDGVVTPASMSDYNIPGIGEVEEMIGDRGSVEDLMVELAIAAA